MKSLYRVFFGAVLLLVFQHGHAAEPKRALSRGDFDGWRTIATPVLSRDGQWLAYALQPQDGDGELVVRHLASGKERRESVGALPPPPATPNEENPEAPPPPRAIRVMFTSDARFLLATTYPAKADMAAARKARKRADDMPKGGLLILNLGDPAQPAVRLANVKNVSVPSKGGAWAAILKEETKAPAKADEPAPAANDDAHASALEDATSDQARRAPARAANAAAGGKPELGTELALRDLASGVERNFPNVLEASFARDGKTVATVVSSKMEAENGVYVLTPGDPAPPHPILAGKGKYIKWTWDREQTQAVFLSDRDDASAKAPAFKAYRWSRGAQSAEDIKIGKDNGAPASMVLSEKGTLAFSRDGKKIYLPFAPPAKPARSTDNPLGEDERVVADLWRWNDDAVQTIQKVRSTQERDRTYRGVWDIATQRYTQVADESLRTVIFTDDGSRAIGLDDRAYRRLTDFDGSYADVVLVDAESGTRTPAIRKLRDAGGAAAAFTSNRLSPDGRWLLYYQDRHWHGLDTQSGATKNLTAAIKQNFFNEDQDTPGPKGAYGTAGWLADSSGVLLYDRFDVWHVFTDGRAPRNVTQGEGRRSQTRLRVQSIEPADADDDERGIAPGKPLVLRGESDVTRASGYFETALSATAKPARLIWREANVRYLGRAQEADVLLMSASRFDRFPDLEITDRRFAAPRAVSEAGAQMQPFAWGSSELMAFKNKKGVPLKAMLVKPAGFDAKKKYPLLVYIYERLSQNVHTFSNPAPGQNINPAFYASNGYVILMPDIAYTAGSPGQDALDAVLPAIDTLIKQGFIDEKAIGIQGHSWGGYQIAWMITQTDRFRAAEAGAPVGNMTSAYSGIRYGSGVPRQFQYEMGQSRIGKSLAEARDLYVANSPVFYAHKVKTPLLILHNDNDNAVPWTQGIELFLALRRNGKEAYFLNYNGALHGLRRRADQKDFGLRLQQYFDHFLKSAPKPEWMDRGIPFNEREAEKERFGAVRPLAEIAK